MRNFIYKLMTDRLNGPVFWPFKAALYLLSLVYGTAILFRGFFYKVGIFNTEKVPLKIISVGNITLGGTGKTPFVIFLSGLLKDELKKDSSILIRGYGWDEQAMLKKQLPDVPVIVGEDRVKSSRRAIRLYGYDTAILDDGFQYWELERSLNIVLVDSRRPFGNGHLFPRGVLREPKSAMRRADVVVFTKVDKKRCDIARLEDGLRRIRPDIVFAESIHRPLYLYNTKAKKLFELSFARGKRVALISSIGDPEYFEEMVKSLGADVAEHLAFPDHHNYDKPGMERIMKRLAERSFDFIITTDKDAVKFNRMSCSFGSYPLMILNIEMRIVSGKEALVDRLRGIYTR